MAAKTRLDEIRERVAGGCGCGYESYLLDEVDRLGVVLQMLDEATPEGVVAKHLIKRALESLGIDRRALTPKEIVNV